MGQNTTFSTVEGRREGGREGGREEDYIGSCKEKGSCTYPLVADTCC